MSIDFELCSLNIGDAAVVVKKTKPQKLQMMDKEQLHEVVEVELEK